MKRGAVLILTKYARSGASSRYRFLQYLPYLEAEGLHCVVSPLFGDDYLEAFYKRRRRDPVCLLKALLRRLAALFSVFRYDLILLEKEIMPFFPSLFERLLTLAGVPYIVDYDDAIFHQYDHHRSAIVRFLFGNKIEYVMRQASLVVAGNEYLAGYGRRAGAHEIEVLPTVVDLTRYPSAGKQEKDGFTIGWIGSPTTSPYVKDICEALAEVCKGGRGKVLMIGSGEMELPGVPLECRGWTEENEMASLLECDVGIMPLPDASWERGKCGFKLIQYMACALPVVASPVGVNTEIVEDGVDGFLAANHREWVSALKALRDDKEMRRDMGKQGRKKVERKYCLQTTGPHLARLVLRVIGKSRVFVPESPSGIRNVPVSVVVPCFRCASTIGRAVASVAAQTSRPEEVILVDDSSGDETRGQLEALQKHYGKGWIRILSTPENGGPSVARNIGWAEAAKPLIAFLDADDAWHPRKIEIQYQWMMDHPDVAMTGHPCMWPPRAEIALQALPEVRRVRQIGRLALLLSNYFSTPSVMLRKDLSFRFLQDKRYSEDYLLWLQIVFSGCRAFRLELPMAYLYKAPYGSGGMSSHMWAMEKGELDTYARLNAAGFISPFSYYFLQGHSLIKYARRLVWPHGAVPHFSGK